MHIEADWTSLEGIATNLLDGNVIAIVIAVVFTLAVPALLHYFLYRQVASPAVRNFLLLGPSGSGKTALVSLVWSRNSLALFSTLLVYVQQFLARLTD